MNLSFLESESESFVNPKNGSKVPSLEMNRIPFLKKVLTFLRVHPPAITVFCQVKCNYSGVTGALRVEVLLFKIHSPEIKFQLRTLSLGDEVPGNSKKAE